MATVTTTWPDDLEASIKPTGFYRHMTTDRMDETLLATELWRALVLIHGREKLTRLLRRDPAAVFAKLVYGRARVRARGVETPIVRGIEACREGKPTNAHIMTPDHPKWPRFLREMKHETSDFKPDAPDDGTFDGEDVPCMAPTLLERLGMAVAESLVVLRAFDGPTDLAIVSYVRLRWNDGACRLCLKSAGAAEAFNGFLG